MAMALGIFAGTGMDARAEGKYEIVEISESDTFDEVREKCTFDDSIALLSDERKNHIKDNYSSLVSSTGKTPLVIYEKSGSAGLQGVYKNSSGYSYSAFTAVFFNQNRGKYSWFLLRERVASPSNASDSEVSPTPHTHSYSWVTVQDVSSEQDGIEEYRCSCGDVQERCVIPRYMAIVKGLYGAVKDAPQNGTATFDSGRLYTISDYVIKKLAERTDVTTVITFEYQNQAYKMTIPAGADFTGLLADEDYFYGYFFFANAVGATIEAL